MDEWKLDGGVAGGGGGSHDFRRSAFFCARWRSALTTIAPTTETNPKNPAMESRTTLALTIYSPSLCSCPQRPKTIPTSRAAKPTAKQPSIQRRERSPVLLSLSSIPNTITRMPPSRRKHPNISEAAFALRFRTRKVHFNSQWSAMYSRSSSIEGSNEQGPKVTTHGNHCAPTQDISSVSNLDATQGKKEAAYHKPRRPVRVHEPKFIIGEKRCGFVDKTRHRCRCVDTRQLAYLCGLCELRVDEFQHRVPKQECKLVPFPLVEKLSSLANCNGQPHSGSGPAKSLPAV